MIYLPILGALALAGGTIFSRHVLKKRKVNIKLYMNAEFLAIVIVMIPIIYFFWKLDAQALELKNILIFTGVIVLSIIANFFAYYSIKREKVSNIEPARVLEPLFVIILALILSFLVDGEAYERNFKVVIPALLSSVALIFSHVKKHHLKFNKYFIAAIFGSLFFAFELVLSKLILEYYSPVTFYFLRCSFVFIFAFIFFKPNFKELKPKVKIEIMIMGVLWVVYRIAIYYGYLNYGIISTTLVIMLGPVFIYLFAWKFLKEKLNWRNIVAAFIIVGSIVYVLLE